MKRRTDTLRPRDYVLSALHLLLAVVFFFLSFLLHGRLPGMSADSSAAAGFLVFFFLGIPIALVVLGTLFFSLLAEQRWLGVLSGMMLLAAILALVHAWAGALASLAYLGLAGRFAVRLVLMSRTP